MNTSLLPYEIGVLLYRLSNTHNSINAKLKKVPPSYLILGTTITLVAINILAKSCQQRWGETRREQIGRLALQIPYVRDKYIQDIKKQLVAFQESVRKKWEKFGPLFITIPEEGWDLKSLLKLVDCYSQVTISAVQDKHISGTIYSKSLDKEGEIYTQTMKPEMLKQEAITNDAEFFSDLSKKLQTVFTYAFERSYLWNSLHGTEFAIGSCIDYQVVRMVADLFGGKPQEVMGFGTSGGTESLMLAIRIYREWGIRNRGHQPGTGVVIASKDVHASILKAGAAYLVNVELVDTDESGKVNIAHLQKVVKKHGNNVIAIIASAPSYSIGVIDNINEIAQIAQNNGCGLHVDCCLGLFIVNFLKQYQTNYLSIPGVTSVSGDNHKNGFSPKGSSVVVTKPMGSENLAYYSIYSVPEWSGGVYGTPKDAGSQSCVNSLNALLAMLAIGKNGYKRIALAVHNTTVQLAKIINKFEGKLKLVAQPEVNVVAFEMDKTWGLQKGAIYAFAHTMAERNIILSTLNNDKVHFCVTARFAGDDKALKEFEKAITESLEAVKNLNETLLKNGQAFPGDAGMYCELEAAMHPNKEELSIIKFIQNLLFGRQGAKDAVRAYFLAQLDPFTS